MTIADVAAALGVSKTTVSRAINGTGRIAPETSERVRKYMEEKNFRPNTVAQNLAARRTNNVAFTVPPTDETGNVPFFMRCMAGVNKTAERSGYSVVVADGDLDGVRRVVESRKVDGVVLSRNLSEDAALNYLKDCGIPFVLVGTADVGGVVCVDNDNRAACREFTALLLEKWNAVPGLIVGSELYAVNRSRENGFTDALTSARINTNGVVRRNAVDEAAVVAAFRSLYENGVRAFFCGDDLVCSYLSHNLRDEDVYVASFYNGDILEHFRPNTPAIDFDAGELGSRACDLLLRIIGGETVPASTMLGHRFKGI